MGAWPTHERTAARLVGMSPAGVSRLARAPASAGAACCGQAAAGPYAARQLWGRALGGTGLGVPRTRVCHTGQHFS